MECDTQSWYDVHMSPTATRLTNSEIAETIHMSVSGISRLRSGSRRPSLSVAAAILDAYLSDDDPNDTVEAYVAFSAGGQQQATFLAKLWG